MNGIRRYIISGRKSIPNNLHPWASERYRTDIWRHPFQSLVVINLRVTGCRPVCTVPEAQRQATASSECARSRTRQDEDNVDLKIERISFSLFESNASEWRVTCTLINCFSCLYSQWLWLLFWYRKDTEYNLLYVFLEWSTCRLPIDIYSRAMMVYNK